MELFLLHSVDAEAEVKAVPRPRDATFQSRFGQEEHDHRKKIAWSAWYLILEASKEPKDAGVSRLITGIQRIRRLLPTFFPC